MCSVMFRRIYSIMLGSCDAIVVNNFDEIGCTFVKYFDSNLKIKYIEGRANLDWMWDGPVTEWHKNGVMRYKMLYSRGEIVTKMGEWDEAGNET